MRRLVAAVLFGFGVLSIFAALWVYVGLRANSGVSPDGYTYGNVLLSGGLGIACAAGGFWLWKSLAKTPAPGDAAPVRKTTKTPRRGAKKVCPECEDYVPADARTCQSCGHDFAPDDFNALRLELATATDEWTTPVVVRSYGSGDEGRQDYDDEAMVLVEEHDYKSSLVADGNGLTATFSKGTPGGEGRVSTIMQTPPAGRQAACAYCGGTLGLDGRCPLCGWQAAVSDDEPKGTGSGRSGPRPDPPIAVAETGVAPASNAMGIGAMDEARRFCGQCGAAHDPADMFCRACGKPITAMLPRAAPEVAPGTPALAPPDSAAAPTGTGPDDPPIATVTPAMAQHPRSQKKSLTTASPDPTVRNSTIVGLVVLAGLGLSAGAIALASGGALGAATGGPVTVTYRLSGSAAAADVKYTIAGGEHAQETGATVPLGGGSGTGNGVQVGVHHGAYVSLEAKNSGAAGDLECSIEADGSALTTNRSMEAGGSVLCGAFVP